MKHFKKFVLPVIAIAFLALILAVPAKSSGEMVIFVKDNTGAGTGDGTSAANALTPENRVTVAVGTNNQQNTALYQAWEQIFTAGVSNATIVICGEYTITNDDCYMASTSWSNADFKYTGTLKPDVNITYTSVYDGVDYRETAGATIKLTEKSQLAFPSATTTENITFTSANRSNSNKVFLAASCCNLVLGNNTQFSDPTDFQIIGGARSNGSATSASTNITVDIGNTNQIGDIYGLSNGDLAHTGTSSITIKSGTVVGNIAGDGVLPNSVGINGNVQMSFQGGVIQGKVWGVTEGFVNSNGSVAISITGGDFTNCQGIYVTDGVLSTATASSTKGTLAPATATVDLTALSVASADAVREKIDSEFSKQLTQAQMESDGYYTSDEVDLRGMVVQYMYDMANVQWIAASDMDFRDMCNSTSLYYRAGQTYLGMTYNDNRTGIEQFRTILDASGKHTGVYSSTEDAWQNSPGNSCATSVEHAWQVVSPTIEYEYSRDMMPYYPGTNVLPVGDIDWSTYDGSNTNSIIAANSQTVVMEAYALTHAGDGINRYLGTGGHAMMITKEPEVVRDAQGNIDPNNSYIYLTDQNNGLNNSRQYPSSYTVDAKKSFALVYSEGYLPVTFAEVQQGRAPIPTFALDGDVQEAALNQGYLTGSIESNYNLMTITAEVTANGQVVASASAHPYTKRFALQEMSDDLGINQLASGNYHLTIAAEVGLGSKTLVNMDFTRTTDMVVFVKDNVGAGTGSGNSAANALAPETVVTAAVGNNNQRNTALYQAWEKIFAAGVSNATIVICGEYTITDDDCYMASTSWSNADYRYVGDLQPNVTITYTSVYGGVDYRETAGAAIKLTGKSQFAFPSATKTEDLTFISASRSNTNKVLIGANCCDLVLGNDTTFENPTDFRIIGGARSNGTATSGSTSVTVDIGNENEIGDIYGLSNADIAHTGTSSVTIKSGTVVGNIAGDGVSANSVGINGHVVITVEGGIIKGKIWGVTEGFVNDDGSVTIAIEGGDFTDCTGIHVTDGTLSTATASDTRGTKAPATATLNLREASPAVAAAAQAKADANFTVTMPMVIFVKDNVGAGTGDGSSAANALAPEAVVTTAVGNNNQQNTALYQAWEQIFAAGVKNATIVICGEYTITDNDCYMASASWSNADFKYTGALKPDVTITYTSVYGGVDYRETANATIKLTERSQFAFPSATVTENITFTSANRTNTNRVLIGASCCDLLLGSDTQFVNPADFTIIGGTRSNSSATAVSTSITVDIGNANQIGDIYGLSNADIAHVGTSNIVIKSGTVVGNIAGDGVSTNSVGINGKVQITIEGGIIKGKIWGVTEGFVNDDGKVTVTVTGGNFTNCAGIFATDGTLSTATPSATKGTKAPARAVLDLNGLSAADAIVVRDKAASDMTVDMPLVIFVKDNVGAGTGDGSSAANALAPIPMVTTAVGNENQRNTALYQAWEQIFASGEKNATIVICGEYTLTDDDCYMMSSSWSNADFKYVWAPKADVTITYTSVFGGVDYRETANATIKLTERSQFAFPSATITENITFTSANRSNGNKVIIGASCCDLLLGNDTQFVNPTDFLISGGVRSNNADTDGSTNIIVDIGNSNQIGSIYGLSNADRAHTGTSNIVIKSGTIVGDIAGDGVYANSVGIDGNVQITIEGGIIKGNIWGVTEGFVNSDGSVLITITGGNFTDCQGINVTDGTLSTATPSATRGTLAPATATIDLSALGSASATIVQGKLGDGFTVNLP